MANYKDDVAEMKVKRQDFMMALEEVRPAFGVSEEDLEACVQGGLISYSSGIEVCHLRANLTAEYSQRREVVCGAGA
jgi:vesicle-fusing ATPase